MRFLLLFLMLVFPFITNAGNHRVGEGKLIKTSVPSRPHKPSTDYIGCIYQEDTLILDFSDLVEYAQVTITDGNGGFITSEILYADDPTIQVALTEGEYEITCRTDGNQIFSGVIYIQ